MRDCVNPRITTLKKSRRTVCVETDGPAEPLSRSRAAPRPGPKPPRRVSGRAHAWGAAGAGRAARWAVLGRAVGDHRGLPPTAPFANSFWLSLCDRALALKPQLPSARVCGISRLGGHKSGSSGVYPAPVPAVCRRNSCPCNPRVPKASSLLSQRRCPAELLRNANPPLSLSGPNDHHRGRRKLCFARRNGPQRPTAPEGFEEGWREGREGRHGKGEGDPGASPVARCPAPGRQLPPAGRTHTDAGHTAAERTHAVVPQDPDAGSPGFAPGDAG